MVADAPRTPLPQPRESADGRRLHRFRRFVPRRKATTVGGGLHRTADRTTLVRPAPRRRACRRRPRARFVRPATRSTRLHFQLLRRAATAGGAYRETLRVAVLT